MCLFIRGYNKRYINRSMVDGMLQYIMRISVNYLQIDSRVI